MVEGARVVRSEEVDWIEPPLHFGSYSKLLINPENSATKSVDFRVSITRPHGRIEQHVHERAENIYYVVKGRGIVELDGERHLMDPGMLVFIPPGVEHALFNTGFEDLVTVVVACPADDMDRSSEG
jgi:mannose-6-phosphate isomerase-like protein (cupin superfamily)